MSLSKLLCLLVVVGTQICTANERPLPRFEDYSAARESMSPGHKPVIVGKENRRYATMLRNAAKQPPNFAGHYVLAAWGCGASCLMGAAIDAKTGMVIWLPFTVCCWPLEITEPLEFKTDSRLLIVRGSRNEKGGGVYYYLLDNQHLTLLRAIEKGHLN
jgi:hypothetical protein